MYRACPQKLHPAQTFVPLVGKMFWRANRVLPYGAKYWVCGTFYTFCTKNKTADINNLGLGGMVRLGLYNFFWPPDKHQSRHGLWGGCHLVLHMCKHLILGLRLPDIGLYSLPLQRQTAKRGIGLSDFFKKNSALTKMSEHLLAKYFGIF